MQYPQRKTPWWFVLGTFTLLLSGSAFAAPIFNVNSTADAVDDNPGDGLCHTIAGTCTLRAAVMEANRTSGIGATINLPVGTYTLLIPAAGSDDEASGDLNLTAPTSGDPHITIAGAGTATTIIDANQMDRVVRVEASRKAQFQGITLRGGYVTNGGGGILNFGTLVLDHVSISSNSSETDGGGIYNVGAMTLDGVTLGPQNSAAISGGGVFNLGTLEMERSSVIDNQGFEGGGLANEYSATITNSTFSRNRSNDGGGISNEGAITVSSSTIANNHAQTKGGGIIALATYSNFSTRIFNATIAGNAAYADDGSDGDGGGIYVYGGIVDVRNTLVVGNYFSGGQGSLEDCYTTNGGTLRSLGANLVTTVGASCNFTGTGLSTLNSLDFLGTLKDNGGTTQTIALLQGSNAINAGINCTGPDGNPLPTDQRGFARVVGSACDVGAYEFDPDRIFTNGFE